MGNAKTRKQGNRVQFGFGTALRIAVIFFLLFILYWVWERLAVEGFRYEWQWNRVWRHFGHWGPQGFVAGPLCKGLLLTVYITFAGAIFGVVCGLCAALANLGPWKLCQWLSRIYIGIWRGTPLLQQLFFAYFLVSPLLGAGPVWIAILALGLFEGAYFSEIFRAGILSVPPAQWEAALSLGFDPAQVFRMIILPQAWANIQPSLVNQRIAVLKDSSLVSAIAVADLTMQSQAVIAETFLAFEVWLLAGAIYLALALCIAMPGLWHEYNRKWRN